MNSIFQSFLDKGYRYEYKNGPDIVTNEEQALYEGLNCITLIHLLIKKLFDITLPSHIRIVEIYKENPYFHTIQSIDELKIADVIFLGKKDLPEHLAQYVPRFDVHKNLLNEEEGKQIIGDKFAGHHIAMYIGEQDSSNDPLFIHIGSIDKTVSIWPLQKFLSREKYSVLYRIKRLNTISKITL